MKAGHRRHREHGLDQHGPRGRRPAVPQLRPPPRVRPGQPQRHPRAPDHGPPVLPPVEPPRRVGSMRAERAEAAEALHGDRLQLLQGRVEGVVREGLPRQVRHVHAMAPVHLGPFPNALVGASRAGAAGAAPPGRAVMVGFERDEEAERHDRRQRGPRRDRQPPPDRESAAGRAPARPTPRASSRRAPR